MAFALSICVAVLGSHWTVKPLWAASHWLVSFFRPALSAAVMEPVFGGSTALMTLELLPEPPERASGREAGGQQHGSHRGQPSGQGSGRHSVNSSMSQ